MPEFLPTPTETLAQFAKRVRLANKWTLKDVEKNSNHTIRDSYVSLIENGRVLNPSFGKLKALADGLKISREVMSGIAFEKTSKLSHDEEELISSFRLMEARAQSDLLIISRALRDQHPGLTDDDIEIKAGKPVAVKSKKKH